jgi:hypothetical protein
MDLDKLPLSWRDAENDQVFQPGDVLKLRSGQVVLVGDVNTMLGVCDDCRDFGPEDIEAMASIWEVIDAKL